MDLEYEEVPLFISWLKYQGYEVQERAYDYEVVRWVNPNRSKNAPLPVIYHKKDPTQITVNKAAVGYVRMFNERNRPVPTTELNQRLMVWWKYRRYLEQMGTYEEYCLE